MNVSEKYYTDTVEGLRERVGFLLAELAEANRMREHYVGVIADTARKLEAAEAERDEARKSLRAFADAEQDAHLRAEAAEAEVARLRGLLGEWLRTGETSGGYTLRQRTTAALGEDT